MSRSCFALLTLLASLAGPLVFARPARSEQPLPTCPAEAYGVQSVCTPPSPAVHPTDSAGLVPYPSYGGEYGCEYADADAEAAWSAPLPAHDSADEHDDWRDFVVENEPSSISNTYDDLFDSWSDVAAEDADVEVTAEPAHPAIVEADADAYKPDSTAAAEYDPYDMDFELRDPEYASIEAYEAEFSGYGTTDYLQDNYHYEPLTNAPSGPSGFSKVARRWCLDALDSVIVQQAVQLGSEVWFDARQLADEYTFDAIVESSELAWDRLEEYRRLSSPPVPKVTDEVIGYRLAGDDCGWDCWFGMRSGELSPNVPTTVVVPAAPAVSHASLQRETLLAAAISLQSLSDQLEAASNWLASLGGVDVAKLKTGHTAR